MLLISCTDTFARICFIFELPAHEALFEALPGEVRRGLTTPCPSAGTTLTLCHLMEDARGKTNLLAVIWGFHRHPPVV